MGRRKILVVEDNTDELLIYTTLLAYSGYEILSATDFDSALRIARAQKPDLAVVDVNLGDTQRDGCDLVDALRASEETRSMPIIAHTAFGDVYRKALEAAGCEAIIHKPTSPQLLIQTIESLIGPAEDVSA